MYFKLTVLGCLLGMSAGVVMASSLRDSPSSPSLTGEEGLEGGALARPAGSASAAGAAKHARPVVSGFETAPIHGLPAHNPNAPMPPSWQSLLPGAIRL